MPRGNCWRESIPAGKSFIIKYMHLKKTILCALSSLAMLSAFAQVAQISIPRIDLMPNEPSPYNVRDWRQVALRYDSFVYDLQKTGQYLPLAFVTPTGVNYPQQPSFGLHSYVGTNSPSNGEAINVLPSLVGATLCGANKTNQYGRNWLSMSQDYFNKNNGELLYLNSPAGGSGSDWWYDLMPNVYFYQLYDLYPNMGGDAPFQFNAIADRFLTAVQTMGGSATPWHKANMDYRAWNFKTMQPNANGVHEPEAAGAYAWLLYNAYRKTGNPAYRQGAEWSMEFLSEWATNPSYELQLPYGTYTAAKMNAELGTKYDVEKMVNWSFNRGPLRGWGTDVGTWGSFDISGIVGEANDAGNDYAFQMNGVQQAAMLVPMVRYDKRFARAIGKWMLNLTNATRLFYPGFLPAAFQDASAWSAANDPDRVIGYEALRQKYQGMSPFSTGDAVNGGWAGTNLALYGCSSIGYLGSIVEKTNVDKILKINLLKTDFYRNSAYPSFLLFNPFAQSKSVDMPVGPTPVDVYDALTEKFILQGVSGTVQVNVPANGALLVALTPAGGAITYDKNKMLVDGVVADFQQTAHAFTYAPRIKSLATAQPQVAFNDSTTVFSSTSDQDSNQFTWTWSTSGGTISGAGPNVHWIAPAISGNYTITLIVTDESNNRDTATVTVKAVAQINLAPQITAIEKSIDYAAVNGAIQLTCVATDPNGDPLSYTWSVTGGSISGSGNTVTWNAPASEGIFKVSVTVADNGGLNAQASTNLLVKNFNPTTGTLIAYYPFSGNANDLSGNQLNGLLSGGALIGSDFWNHTNSACQLDGLNDNVTVANSPILNVTDAITISCWFRQGNTPDHETFLISHGSWQNRWKISFTPDHKIRWTVNSLISTGDLDSEVPIAKDSIYHLSVTFDGALMALYLNGKLHSYKPLAGKIRTTTIPLLIGQILPGTTDYNFKGTIDEVKIFDYALTPDAARALYESHPVSVNDTPDHPATLRLSPNPAGTTIRIAFPEAGTAKGMVSFFDYDGRLVSAQPALPGTTIDFNTEDWKPGIYVAVFKSDSVLASARFMKM
jgi:hypothetical protein